MIKIKNDFKAGDPPGIEAEWLNTIGTFYNTLEMMYGEVIRSTDGKVILNPYLTSSGGMGGRPSYFDVKTVDSEAGTITIRGGVVKMTGRGMCTVPDTEITPGGSSGSPDYVHLKVTVSGTLVATIECTSSYPEDDGTYYRRALWEVYQVDGVPAIGPKCDELAIRNPIGP